MLRTRLHRSSRALVLVLVTAAAACGAAGDAASGTEATVPVAVQLAPENVTTARVDRIVAGPRISGQLTPAREATVRALVGGSIVALPVDRGEPVRAGQEVARIASRDLEAALASARAAITSAETALAVATSEQARTASLVEGGALAARDLEQAGNAVSAAEAQLVAARARETSVLQQIDDTSLRAPFDGLVSRRQASIGDVVSPGTEVVTIIDPSSMRLEALVPSDQLAAVRRGAPVDFDVRGIPGTSTGRVDRLDSTADPVTRQVAVFVTLPNTEGQLIAGLFAEGRIETSVTEGVVVPLSAVDEAGAVPFVTRIEDGRARRVTVDLGARQLDTEQVEVVAGVDAGDVLIVGSAMGVADGTPVAVTD